MVGNPGKIVKYRFSELQIDLLQKIEWWNWDDEKIKYEFKTLWSSDIDSFINKHINTGVINVNMFSK